MMRCFSGVLLGLIAASCSIPVNRQSAESIPTELAVSKLAEMLPKSSYVKWLEPGVLIDQSEITGWSVTKELVEFSSRRNDPFRLSWSVSRGAELVKFPFRYELRVYAAVPGNARKNVVIFNWKDEAEARRAAELFESLRGDR